jgi:hypothetical protein
LKPAVDARPALFLPSWRRAAALIVFALATIARVRYLGLPLDPMLLIGWFWLGTIAWNIDRSWRDHLRFARDWAPIVVLLYAYGFSRGAADALSAPHITAMIDADHALFGALPTLWLQHRFYARHEVRWYDVIASIVYFSHFIVCMSVAVVLWLRRRALWAAFMRRWVALNIAGLITYFLFPAAPPWWASVHHYLADPVARISARGWSAIGLTVAGNLLGRGQQLVNPVAAMPSLHAGFTLLVVVFFFPMVARRYWPLLLAYPLTMALTLVYTGEHYAIDAIVGFAYVGAVCALVALAERWWRRRRLTAEAEALLVAEDARAEAMDTRLAARAVPPPAAAGEAVH